MGNAFGFNGATAFLPWKSHDRRKSWIVTSSLQWGHGISAVEIDPEWRANQCAKMLQWGHGISAVEIV